MGDRADSGLIRHGAAQASVTAEFDLPDGHPAFAILAEQDMDAEGQLVIRRTVGTDGRSRGFVNDQPVSAGLLRRLAETLIEIHGQFETHGLFDQNTHRLLLDAYGGLSGPMTVAATWRDWSEAQAELGRLVAEADSAARRGRISARRPSPSWSS